MKKIIILIVFGIFLISGCSTKTEENRSYTVAIDSDKEFPFSYIDKNTGKISGFESDLIREIANRGNFKVDFIEKSLSLIQFNVKKGEIDMGIGTLSITDERKKDFKFSVPYMEELVVVLANKKNKIESKRKEIYGIVSGTSYIENLKNIEFLEEVDNNKVIENLMSKEIDYAIMAKRSGDIYISKNPELYIKKVLQKDSIGILFNKDISDNFINKVNEIILKMKEDGSLKALKKKNKIND